MRNYEWGVKNCEMSDNMMIIINVEMEKRISEYQIFKYQMLE